jgi:glucose-6-phosphate isomerase
MLIAQICGLKLEDIRQGALKATQSTLPILNMAQNFLKSFERRENITLFWFYHSNFRWFGGWLQQLWAESLGKKTNRAGQVASTFSTPMIAIGSCDQHSILQQVAHGPKDKFVCIFNFQSVENSDYTVEHVLFKNIDFMQGRKYGELIACQSKATYEALKQNGVSTELISIDDTNPSYSLGYLFMFFQLVVATLGEHENINAFDQPGVALGKDITLQMLQEK